MKTLTRDQIDNYVLDWLLSRQLQVRTYQHNLLVDGIAGGT